MTNTYINTNENTLETNVRSWYMNEYPTDELGENLPKTITFKDYEDYLNSGKDIYKLMGQVADSIIRERIFIELADIMNVSYKKVYDTWLYS